MFKKLPIAAIIATIAIALIGAEFVISADSSVNDPRPQALEAMDPPDEDATSADETSQEDVQAEVQADIQDESARFVEEDPFAGEFDASIGQPMNDATPFMSAEPEVIASPTAPNPVDTGDFDASIGQPVMPEPDIGAFNQ